MKWLWRAVGAIVLAWASVYLLGAWMWERGTAQLRAGLARGEAVRVEPEELPEPVRRYFEVALPRTPRMIASVEMEHEGTFNMSEGETRWLPFRSTQVDVMHPAGFDWSGRIEMMPGVPVYVHDAFVGGRGILAAKLWGLIPLASMWDSQEVDSGELQRFLAEAAWYPTRLLPQEGVQWTPEDSRRAYGTLRAGDIEVTLEFHFGADHLIEGIRAERRYRAVGDRFEATPWEGRFSNYQNVDGMKIPMDGEVAWVLKSERKPYWRGHTTHIAYTYR
jgi:hypothetical protein